MKAGVPASSGCDQLVPVIATLYSQVSLANSGGATAYEVTLCYPDDADPARGLVSILSPLGAGLLGLRAGETAVWRSFGREQSARVLAVRAASPAP